LDGFEDGRVCALRKLRQRVPKVAAIGRRHHDVASRPDQSCRLGQKIIGMRDVLDYLGDEDRVEQ
jgi:hypothetical protein